MYLAKKSEITSVLLTAEMMMYGYMWVRIDKSENGISAAWYGMADGGIVTEDDEKMLEGRDFGKLVGMICEMDFPDEEDYECSMLWSVQFRNEEDEVVEELEPGCWNMELLKNVIVCFDNFLNDDEVMAQFREVLEW